MKRFLCLTLCLALLLLTGCRQAAGPEQPENPGAPQKLQVVSTIFPPYDFIREIAGETVDSSMLLSPGAESHSYDPTPQDIIAIQNSDLFLYVGGGSDLWVTRILESMDTSGMTVIALTDLVDVVEEELVEGMEAGHSHSGEDHDEDGHDESEHEEDGHDHSEDEHSPELDEHVWTSPKNAMLIVEALTSTLSGLDERNAALYEANAAGYLEQLSQLDARFEQLGRQAARHTIVFGDRFPFRYLADAYGLDYYAAFPGCSTETEASAATVAFLINKVKDEAIPVVFHIELSNEKMADTICEGTGAAKLLLHSCHNVSRDEFRQGATYLSLMEQNLQNLSQALA